MPFLSHPYFHSVVIPVLEFKDEDREPMLLPVHLHGNEKRERKKDEERKSETGDIVQAYEQRFLVFWSIISSSSAFILIYFFSFGQFACSSKTSFLKVLSK